MCVSDGGKGVVFSSSFLVKRETHISSCTCHAYMRDVHILSPPTKRDIKKDQGFFCWDWRGVRYKLNGGDF